MDTERTGNHRFGPRQWAFIALLVALAALTLAVVVPTPVGSIDEWVTALGLDFRRWPQWHHAVDSYVMVGQRVPSTLPVLPWFCWRSYRSRSVRPLAMLATALVLLNVGVGALKVLTGRLGPRQARSAMLVFSGGDIFPSGHVANSVVLYGTIALVAVSWRRLLAVVTVVISLSVGLSTIYLRTHWASDIVGGWLAGGLVLVALPAVVPRVERVVGRVDPCSVARGRST